MKRVTPNRAGLSVGNELYLYKRGFQRQASAIWALIFKEYKIRLGKSRIGLFWSLFEPIVGMSIMSAVWWVSGRTSMDGVHITLFIGSGFIAFNTVKTGFGFIAHAIQANMSLLNYPQVKPLDTILARFIYSMIMHAWASVLLLCLVWWLIGAYPTFPDPLMCVEVIVVGMLLALGIATPLAVLGVLNDNVFKVVGIITSPLVILSGVIFSISDLPAQFQEILAYNPLLHITVGFRAGALGSPLFSGFDLGYPLECAVIGLGVGYALYFKYRFRLLQS